MKNSREEGRKNSREGGLSQHRLISLSVIAHHLSKVFSTLLAYLCRLVGHLVLSFTGYRGHWAILKARDMMLSPSF